MPVTKDAVDDVEEMDIDVQDLHSPSSSEQNKMIMKL
jgi:hypothetical protein